MSLPHFASRHRLTATRLAPVVILVAYWLLNPHPALSLLAAGSVVALAGQAIRLWAAGHLIKHAGGAPPAPLATDGPFAYTRHPLYFGSTLMGVGLCLASGVWWTFALVAGILALFYIPTALREESHLREVYGDGYARYRRAVPGLGVRLTPYRAGTVPIEGRAAANAQPHRGLSPSGGFAVARVLSNGEHVTSVLTVVLLAIMWARLAFCWIGSPGNLIGGVPGGGG